MKIFAMFLPQFHEIPENNEWWGERFTEWVKVKTAKPLFKGHRQPIEPLCGYYDLLERSTVEWQTSLMHQYGIDGMVYYHYYFSGKLLLEKPAENLLKWKDIDQSFFFCWANHSWTMAWEQSRKMLIEQKYGDKSDWETHYQYFLQFFQDERYEKVDNKPVLMIYDISFPEYREMMSYFADRCVEDGFAGLYVIERPVPGNMNLLDGFEHHHLERHSHYREPDFTIRSENIKTHHSAAVVKRLSQKALAWMGVEALVEKFDGNRVFDLMTERDYQKEDIPGLFFSWDNTPRYGRNGYIVMEPDYEHFVRYMNKIVNAPYVLVKAWNEWSEGMILEPTKDLKYKYLEWIKRWREEAEYENYRDNSGQSRIQRNT